MTLVANLNVDAIGRAAERYGVAELSLFGSVVTGDFSADSDIDFLVDFLPGREDPFEDFRGLRDELAELVERDVDVVVKRSIRNPYFRDVALAQAEVIYGVSTDLEDVLIENCGRVAT